MNRVPNNLYLEFLRTMPVACVDVAVVDGGQVLLVRRAVAPAKGQWWLPGGRIFKGETMRDAARRKALEEVGLDCWVGPVVHQAETVFEDGPGGVAVHSVNSCFLLFPSYPGQRVVLDRIHEAHRWVAETEGGLHAYVRACLEGAGFR